MTRRVFSAGFAWSVIETKWPGFEKAFLGFKPGPLTLAAGRVLGRADEGHAHRAQRRQDHVGARQCRLRAGHREGARQLRQVPGEMAVLRRGRAARTACEARQPARRQYRPDDAALPRLGRVCHVEGRGRCACAMPASISPRRSPRSATLPRCRRSSTPGPRRPVCPMCRSRGSARCRSARITRPEKLASMVGADD